MAEPVDALELIADEEELAAGDKVDQLALEPVRVLELVDEHVGEPLAVRLRQVGPGEQKVARAELEVGEVHQAARVLQVAVRRVEQHQQPLQLGQVGRGQVVAGGLLQIGQGVEVPLVGRDLARTIRGEVGQVGSGVEVEQRRQGIGLLRPGKLRGGRLRCDARRGQVAALGRPQVEGAPGAPKARVGVEDHRAQAATAVGGEEIEPAVGPFRQEPLEREVERLVQEHPRAHVVGDRKARIEAGLEGVSAEDAKAEAMDRRDPRGVDGPGLLHLAGQLEPLAHPAPELGRRPVGERDREQAVDGRAVAEPAQHALDQNRGLPRAGARRHEHPPAPVDGLALLDVEAVASWARHPADGVLGAPGGAVAPAGIVAHAAGAHPGDRRLCPLLGARDLRPERLGVDDVGGRNAR